MGDPLGQYLCHVQAENLAYTLLRSILLAKPERLNEVFNFIHSLDHSRSKLKHNSRRVKQNHSILLYWQEKAAICESCTVSMSEH